MDKLIKSYEPFQPLLTREGLQCYGLSLQCRPSASVFSNIVHSYLQITSDKATRYPMIPDATQAVFFSPDVGFIGGARSKACEIELPCAGEYFGIRFYPGALRHFFKLNLADITEQMVDHYYFPNQTFASLHEKIYQRKTFSTRAAICERWLLTQFEPMTLNVFDYALSLIYQSIGNIQIETLAHKVGLSSRHLNRLFQRYTGLSSKSFTQIIRLQRVAKQLSRSPSNSLNIATNLGFYDQAHLLKSFKKQFMLNPQMYFSRYMSDFYNR